ncbi:MAG: hypothetical protein A3A81_00715 [Omnitrophica bacterium RIFCSPLOWO2_01_FULL_45_10b]|nr:MAG: hypothetical protein A3A81_00715 [Omnitrophica bacterium RIFCSPLOWO2_01_FULL_45_10b]
MDRALKDFLKLGGLDFATDVTRRIILKEILNTVEFQYFKEARGQSGFLDLVGKMIVELKEYLILPDEFEKRLQPLKGRFPEFEFKYNDLVKIDQAYEFQLKKRGLIDQRDSLKLLEEGLERGEFVDPNLKKVWIDGFSDFSKLQFSFIEFLTRHADEVTVTLTIDEDPLRRPLFEIVSETQSTLEDIGFQKKWLNQRNHRTESEDLAHLERNLFRTSPVIAPQGLSRSYGKKLINGIASATDGAPSGEAPAQQNGGSAGLGGGKQSRSHEIASASSGALPRNDRESAIQIFEATGLSGELEMIAREIKRLARTHGYHFSDMALLLRATDPYVSVIQSVFRRFQIPFELHERWRLSTSPIARTLVSFLQIFLNDWNRNDLFNFLKSSYVRTNYELVCAIELQALQKGIFKDRAYWLRSFSGANILHEIAHFEDQFLGLKTAAEFTRWIEAVMKHFGLLDFPDTANEKTCFDRESARRILLLLEELKMKSGKSVPSLRASAQQNGGSAVSGGGKRSNLSPEIASTSLGMPSRNDEAVAFARGLMALVEVDLFSIHSRDKNKVQIYNISLARQKEYKVVFLAGLLEKQFPIQIKEDPLLSDIERQALNEHGEILKERLPRQAFERYLFYLAVTRAKEHLILSYPRFDLEGKEALRSFYVDEVERLFSVEVPKKKQHVADVLPDWRDIASEEEGERFVVDTIWSRPEGKRDIHKDHIAFALFNHLRSQPGFASLVRRLFHPAQSAILDERIKPKFLPHEHLWSPTYLELYGECPYRFFSQKVLQLESQQEGIDFARRGTILHDTLEKFFTWFRDVKHGKVSFEEAGAFALETFRNILEKEPLTGERYYRLELQRKWMEEKILGLLRAELVDGKFPLPGLSPKYFEYEFTGLTLCHSERSEGSKNKDSSPVAQNDITGKDAITLRGKIDRIDVDPSGKYALVIDYKTGKNFKKSNLEDGVSLQLPIYLRAVKEKLGLEPLGAHLYSLSSTNSTGFHHKENLDKVNLKTKKGVPLSEKEFEDLLDGTANFAERYAEGIERAEIPVRPRDCADYCPYSALCRIEKWRLKHIYREISEEDKQLKSTQKGQAQVLN